MIQSALRTAVTAPTEPSDSLASLDLFSLGRAATAKSRSLHHGRGVFMRSKQLLGTGGWRGPRDAALSFVEEEDLAAEGGLGGLSGAIDAGIRAVVVASPASTALVAQALQHRLRVLVRWPYAWTDSVEIREKALAALTVSVAPGGPLSGIDGIVPTATDEPQGLDTLVLFSRLRLAVDVPHLCADFVKLGHRLAQMALGFGGDELWGPIHPERALRLGANAFNPVMTRKEAAIVLRGAGLIPHERLSDGSFELVEFQPPAPKVES